MASNDRLAVACSGKSESQGGLNLSDLRAGLMEMFPDHADKMETMTRKSLMNYCKRTPSLRETITEIKEEYFRTNVPLSEKQKKYCRCVAHVAGKNKEWCYEHNAWKRSPTAQKKGCYNPYAVCTKTTGRRGRFHCLKFMDLDAMPQNEVAALAKIKGISVAELKRLAKEESKKPGVYY